MKKSIAIVAALLALTGCGQSAAQKQAAAEASASASAAAHAKEVAQEASKKALADFTACSDSLTPLINAIQDIRGQVAVGVTFANYGPVVGRAEAELGKIPKHSIYEPCNTLVLKPIAAALEAYIQASDDWNKCIQNGSSCDSKLQPSWHTADDSVDQAVNGLAGMKPSD